jgi:hypothetical protein
MKRPHILELLALSKKTLEQPLGRGQNSDCLQLQELSKTGVAVIFNSFDNGFLENYAVCTSQRTFSLHY